MKIKYVRYSGYLHYPAVIKGQWAQEWPSLYVSVSVEGDFHPVGLLTRYGDVLVAYQCDSVVRITSENGKAQEFEAGDIIHRHWNRGLDTDTVRVVAAPPAGKWRCKSNTTADAAD